MTSDVTDTEIARIPRGTSGELVLLLSRRQLDRDRERVWLTLKFARSDGPPRHFTVGVNELAALETAMREARAAAGEQR